jgi:hypothetical protein
MAIRLNCKHSFAGLMLVAIALRFLPDVVTWFKSDPGISARRNAGLLSTAPLSTPQAVACSLPARNDSLDLLSKADDTSNQTAWKGISANQPVAATALLCALLKVTGFKRV